MLPPKPKVAQDQQQLLKNFALLAADGKQTLLDFSEFLASRVPLSEVEMPSEEPLEISRPDKESVVAAIRRLKATYPMLDTEPLLNEASVLMGAHLMQGKTAESVIDELHIVFEQAYISFKT